MRLVIIGASGMVGGYALRYMLDHPTIERVTAVEPRKEPNFSYRLLRMIYPVFRALFPNQVIRADDLARAMVDVTIQKREDRGSLVFENRDIRAMVESPLPSERGGAHPAASSRLDGEKQ